MSWQISTAPGDTGWLDDAINASMPESITTQELKKKLKKITSKAEQLQHQITAQRLMDAAAVRHQHPIARVTCAPLIPETTTP